jgi:hypothetical protein
MNGFDLKAFVTESIIAGNGIISRENRVRCIEEAIRLAKPALREWCAGRDIWTHVNAQRIQADREAKRAAMVLLNEALVIVAREPLATYSSNEKAEELLLVTESGRLVHWYRKFKTYPLTEGELEEIWSIDHLWMFKVLRAEDLATCLSTCTVKRFLRGLADIAGVAYREHVLRFERSGALLREFNVFS